MRSLVSGAVLLTVVASATVTSRAGFVSDQATKPAPDTATDWRQFRNTPGLTGVTTASLPEPLRLLWTYDAGAPVESSAAIVEGLVYVGTGDGDLIALDVATGRLKWKYKASSADVGIGSSSPAVAGNTVFVGDLAGVLHAVDIATGAARWTYKTESEIKSSPVVVDGKVLVGSYDGRLYALAAATGRLLWKAATGNYVHATPAVWNGVAYFGGCDEIFHGVRLRDGASVVSLNVHAYTAASPAIVSGTAYFGTFANEVIAVDVSARRVRWRFSDPDRQFPFYSSAAVSDNLVIVGGRDKLIRAISTSSGKQVWSFASRARVDSSPAVTADRVVVGSGDGKLYVLDLRTGKPVWEFDAGAAITASPAIAPGRIVISNSDGKIYGLGK